MSLSATIKTIQDIMRQDVGVDGDAQRVSQLVWLIFLKVFDDREHEYEALDVRYRSPLPEGLRWRSWAVNPEGLTGDALLEFVDGKLFKTLKDLPQTGQADIGFVVRQVFEDAYNYMKSGTLLRKVINKLNEIDFNRQADRHVFGDIYEQILRDLQSAGNAGEYYTPRAVTQFMVDRVDPKLGERVLDPACGTGGFLTCTIEHVRGRYVKTAEDERRLQRSIFGVEKKPLPHLLCVTNMMLHRVEVPAEIRHDNTLSKPLLSYQAAEPYDVILTNPPFGGMEEEGIEANFPAKMRTRETADLFLILILTLLRDGGRAAVVLPDGTLFGEGVKTKIKEKLLAECDLHTIVRLPNGVFNPYTNIKTNLLFFEKGRPTKEIWYYEHPYPAGYKNYSKTRPIRVEEFKQEGAWWGAREESAQAWRVPIEQVKAGGYNLDLKNPTKVAEESKDPEELLREYQEAAAKVAAAKEALKRELRAALEGRGA